MALLTRSSTRSWATGPSVLMNVRIRGASFFMDSIRLSTSPLLIPALFMAISVLLFAMTCMPSLSVWNTNLEGRPEVELFVDRARHFDRSEKNCMYFLDFLNSL